METPPLPVRPDGTVLAPASEAETPPPPIPTPTSTSTLGRLEQWSARELAELEAIAEKVAEKVHAKIAPLLDVLTSTKLVADVAAVAKAPNLTGAFAAVADAAATAREFKCIADGGLCPMHGTIHET